VSIPALILGFMAGLFTFCDQLMMVKFIPTFLKPEIMLKSYDQYHNIYEQATTAQKAELMDPNSDLVASLIRTGVAYSAPITIFINAAALLLGNGTAINYSKYNGTKNLQMAEKT
jgi:Na+-driven multidrug efflux pump